MPLIGSATESIFTCSCFPEGERFLFHRDRGGDELDHVLVRAPNGEEVDLTPGENVKADSPGRTRDDTTFLLSTSERDARLFDIHEHRTGTFERETVFRDDAGFELRDLPPGRRCIAFSNPRTTSESDEIVAADRASGARSSTSSSTMRAEDSSRGRIVRRGCRAIRGFLDTHLETPETAEASGGV